MSVFILLDTGLKMSMPDSKGLTPFELGKTLSMGAFARFQSMTDHVKRIYFATTRFHRVGPQDFEWFAGRQIDHLGEMEGASVERGSDFRASVLRALGFADWGQAPMFNDGRIELLAQRDSFFVLVITSFGGHVDLETFIRAEASLRLGWGVSLVLIDVQLESQFLDPLALDSRVETLEHLNSFFSGSTSRALRVRKYNDLPALYNELMVMVRNPALSFRVTVDQGEFWASFTPYQTPLRPLLPRFKKAGFAGAKYIWEEAGVNIGVGSAVETSLGIWSPGLNTLCEGSRRGILKFVCEVSITPFALVRVEERSLVIDICLLGVPSLGRPSGDLRELFSRLPASYLSLYRQQELPFAFAALVRDSLYDAKEIYEGQSAVGVEAQPNFVPDPRLSDATFLMPFPGFSLNKSPQQILEENIWAFQKELINLLFPPFENVQTCSSDSEGHSTISSERASPFSNSSSQIIDSELFNPEFLSKEIFPYKTFVYKFESQLPPYISDCIWPSFDLMQGSLNKEYAQSKKQAFLKYRQYVENLNKNEIIQESLETVEEITEAPELSLDSSVGLDSSIEEKLRLFRSIVSKKNPGKAMLEMLRKRSLDSFRNTLQLYATKKAEKGD